MRHMLAVLALITATATVEISEAATVPGEPEATAVRFDLGSPARTLLAVPRNPDRPMQAKTCTQALERVREAAKGSSLISPEENRAVLMKAIDHAVAICTEGVNQKRT